jgi:lipoyl-dependent peroxiredoxin
MSARKIKPTEILSEVDLCTGDDGYFLQARLNVSLPGLERQFAQSILDGAHQTGPYSKPHVGIST